MRTTIDLPDELRAKLVALAAKRGLKGYSEIVREAVERYLVNDEEQSGEDDDILELAGTLSEEEAVRVKERIEAMWKRWHI